MQLHKPVQKTNEMSFMGADSVVDANDDAYEFITERMKEVLDHSEYYTSHLKLFDNTYNAWKQRKNRSLSPTALSDLLVTLIERKYILGKMSVTKLFSVHFRKAFSFFQDVKAIQLLSIFCQSDEEYTRTQLHFVGQNWNEKYHVEKRMVMEVILSHLNSLRGGDIMYIVNEFGVSHPLSIEAVNKPFDQYEPYTIKLSVLHQLGFQADSSVVQEAAETLLNSEDMFDNDKFYAVLKVFGKKHNFSKRAARRRIEIDDVSAIKSIFRFPFDRSSYTTEKRLYSPHWL